MTTTEPAAVSRILETDAAPPAPLTADHQQPQAAETPAAELPADPDAALRALEAAARQAETRSQETRRRLDGLFEDLAGRKVPRFPPDQHTAREEGYRSEFRHAVEPTLALAAHAVALAKEELEALGGLGAADLLEPAESFEVAPHAARIADACARLPIRALLARARAAALTVDARPSQALLWAEGARTRWLGMEMNLRSEDWLGLNDLVGRLETRWAAPRRAQRTAPAEARLAKAEAAATRLQEAHWTGSGGPEQAKRELDAHVSQLWRSGIRGRE